MSYGNLTHKYAATAQRRTARECGGCLNDPREKGSSLKKAPSLGPWTETQPGRCYPPVHAARRLDGGQVGAKGRKVKRIRRGALTFGPFEHRDVHLAARSGSRAFRRARSRRCCRLPCVQERCLAALQDDLRDVAEGASPALRRENRDGCKPRSARHGPAGACAGRPSPRSGPRVSLRRSRPCAGSRRERAGIGQRGERQHLVRVGDSSSADDLPGRPRPR